MSAVGLSHRVSCRAYVFTETSLERQLLQDKLRKDGIEPGRVIVASDNDTPGLRH